MGPGRPRSAANRMKTRILKASDPAHEAEAVREGAEGLARGELVVFPTETVYGLGASAVHPAAVEAIHALKERPPEKPFSLHIPDPELAEQYAGRLSPAARRLVAKAWPGPVTLVLPDRRERGSMPQGLLEAGVYYEGTVGLRCPSHRIGRDILRQAGVPVIASSANLAGRPPPHEADQALSDLDGRVPLVVDAGQAQLARPSTVVRVQVDGSFEVLREGAVTARRIARLATTRVLFICTGNLCRSPMATGLARQKLAEREGCAPELLETHGIAVTSAGTGAAAGHPPSDNAIRAMERRGIDIRHQRSRPMTVDLLLAADYIYVMTRGHLQTVRRVAPEVASRAALIDPEGAEVRDPIGGDLDAYEACAAHLEAALERRIQEIA